jgi:cytochrome P450
MKLSEIAHKNNPKEYLITEEDILSQFMTFFFAGMDTTGHLIGICVYKLAL